MRVRLVPPRIIGSDFVALHYLTTRGRQLGIPRDEIWIAADCEEFARLILKHELIELHLRERGVSYRQSHAQARAVVRETHGHTALYAKMMRAIGDD